MGMLPFCARQDPRRKNGWSIGPGVILNQRAKSIGKLPAATACHKPDICGHGGAAIQPRYRLTLPIFQYSNDDVMKA
jgi:hypothetical protein